MKTPPLHPPRLLNRCARWRASFLIFAPLMCGFHPARAAVTEAWVHRYNNTTAATNDRAIKVVSDAAGNIIVTGSTDTSGTGSDMFTTKYSGVNGSVLWQRLYNGPVNAEDEAQAVAVDGSGNVVVVGYP